MDFCILTILQFFRITDKKHEKLEDGLDFHVIKCNKTAIVLPKHMALQLHTILKWKTKPAFFGKDIIV